MSYGCQDVPISAETATIRLPGISMADWSLTGRQKNELFKELGKNYISGLTLSGGDPLHPENREPVGQLVKEIREKFPEKTIWMYTAFCGMKSMPLDA